MHISVCAPVLCGSDVKSRVRDLQVPDSSLTGIKWFVLRHDTSELQHSIVESGVKYHSMDL